MVETFRLRKSLKHQAMVLGVIALVELITVSSVFFLEEPAKRGLEREHSVAILGGMGVAVFGTMLLLSISLWASYSLGRATIDGTTILLRSLFRTRRFDIRELRSLTWSQHPAGGSIVFRLREFKSRLTLSGFEKDDRLRVIRALRKVVPAEVQEQWPMLCHKIAQPLRDGVEYRAGHDPSAKFCTIIRNRYDRLLAPCLVASITLAAGLIAWFRSWQFLVLPALIVGMWLVLRFHVPPEGLPVMRMTSTFCGRTAIFAMLAIVGSLILLIGLALAGIDRSTAHWIALSPMTAALVI
ncbi:MAG: hypothetical protein ACOY3P_07095, partial [Planctomycetota bacterium]